MKKQRCFLVLENGDVYKGYSFGANPPFADDLKSYSKDLPSGEVVFNTGMTGYYEILTDPSYTGQIVTMTYPHIGNYGADANWSEVGPEDEARRKVKASAFIVKSYYRGAVPEGRITLDEFLKENGVCGIEDLDTRKIVLTLRDTGSKKGVIIKSKNSDLSESELDFVKKYFDLMPTMEGSNLISDVGVNQVHKNPKILGENIVKIENIDKFYKYKIALLDCGVKANIIREYNSRGCEVIVVPSDSNSKDILNLNVDALMMSNGPGDPDVLDKQIELVKDLIGKLPIFGICLGHQIISLALGAKSYKMKFGHHGVNHPVRDEITKRVFVTSQNHGFAIDENSLPKDVEVWCRNANDSTLEGIYHKKYPIMCVQHHPEASPGPIDSSWIFDTFLEKIESSNKKEENI